MGWWIFFTSSETSGPLRWVTGLNKFSHSNILHNIHMDKICPKVWMNLLYVYGKFKNGCSSVLTWDEPWLSHRHRRSHRQRSYVRERVQGHAWLESGVAGPSVSRWKNRSLPLPLSSKAEPNKIINKNKFTSIILLMINHF